MVLQMNIHQNRSLGAECRHYRVYDTITHRLLYKRRAPQSGAFLLALDQRQERTSLVSPHPSGKSA